MIRKKLRRSPVCVWCRVNTWPEAVRLAKGMPNWLFRGQSDSSRSLTTSLERLADMYHCPRSKLRAQEEEILYQFQRQAQQHVVHLPDANDDLEWLSMIQHHGGPTRLLDFTRSFYVAAFFAMELAENTAAIWAINQAVLDARFASRCALPDDHNSGPPLAHAKNQAVNSAIRQSLTRAFPENEGTANRLKMTGKGVIAVKPWRLNQRMIIQQGWFLFPNSVRHTFEANLCESFEVDGPCLPSRQRMAASDLPGLLASAANTVALVKILFPRRMHLAAMRDLLQMNITAATLFPGLDGFARSLRFPLRTFDDLGEDADGRST